MHSHSSPRLSVTIAITILAAFLALLLAILINLATSSIPPVLTSYLWIAWPALGVIFLLSLGVSVWQVRRDAVNSSGVSSSLPSPNPQQSSLSLPSSVSALSLPPLSDYHSCMLSYATEDQAFAEKLYADLQQTGVPCWFAPHDLRLGDKLRQKVYEAIEWQDKLLLVLSTDAVDSSWVESEVEVAFERERQPPKPLILFPIRLDDAVMQTNAAWAGDIRRMRYIGDFCQWQDSASYQQALQRLLRDLRK